MTRVIWRKHPFSDKLYSHVAVEGLSIADYVEELRGDLPYDFERFGCVTINDELVPRPLWRRVRPRCRGELDDITVSFHVAPMGGEGGISIATIATLAILVAATVVTAGALSPLLGGYFAAGMIGAKLAGLAIAVVGTLAVSALTPPPATPALAGPGGAAPGQGGTSAALQGNVLQPGAPIPRVCGTFRVFPPLASQPLIDINSKGDEVAEAVYVLAGAHTLADPALGEVGIADLENTEYEAREGLGSDTPLTLVTRFAKTENIGDQLTRTEVNQTDNRQLLDQTTPMNSVSDPFAVRGISGFDEFWMTLEFPIGLSMPQATTQYSMIPIRIRFRRDGDPTWRMLPEFAVRALKAEPRKVVVKVVRGDPPGSPGTRIPQDKTGPFVAWIDVPMRLENMFGTLAGTNINDGTTSNTADVAALSHWAGANWVAAGGGGSRTVNRVEFWPRTNGTGFGTNSANITVELYKKDGAQPATATDGTLVTSQAITDATTRLTPVVFSVADFTSDHVWVHARRTDSTNTVFNLMELRIFGDWRHSTYAVDRFRTVTPSTFGDVYIDKDNAITTTNVRNIDLNEHEVICYLDTATYPADAYDFEIMRGNQIGLTATSASLTWQTYTITDPPSTATANLIADLYTFLWTGSLYIVAADYDFVAGEVVVSRYASVKNSPPVLGTSLALMAIKTQQPADSFSVLASGQVNRWNGSSFASFGPSSNPADHLNDIWRGSNNKRPLPAAMLDVTSLSDLWTSCNTNGYTLDAVFEGRSVKQVARIAAACGYSIERESETFGVILGRDRSAESTIQQFGYRNVRGMRYEKRFLDPLPSAFRIPYRSAADDYRETEIMVFRPGASDDGIYESVAYEGLVTEEAVTARAIFDWKQALFQSITYHMDAPLQWLRSTKGDTCALSFDTIVSAGGSAYVDSVTTSGGNVTGLVLDGSIQTTGTTAMGVLIRCHDGTTLAKQVTSAGDTRTVTFTTPFANPGTSVLDQGCLVLSGPIAETHKRSVMIAAEPKDGTNASLAFVDDITDLLFSGAGVTYVTNLESTSPSSPAHTFTGASIGAIPRGTALLVLGIGIGGPTAITAVTVNGLAASLSAPGQGTCQLWQIERPKTGTTANIVVTTSGGTLSRINCSVFVIDNLGDFTAYDSDTAASDISGTVLTATLDVARGGVAIAHYKQNQATGTMSWTNATERLDDATSTDRYGAADYTNSTVAAVLARVLTVTATNAGTQRRVAAASWR
jgi:hypothetical protein